MTGVARFVRTMVAVPVVTVATTVAAAAALIAVRRDPDGPGVERVTRTWSRVWLTAAGADLTVRGAEKVDRTRSYVVVANHSSALDIMACFLAVPLPIRFLAKRELFRIPLLAPAMRAIGIVEVDRQARMAVHDQINQQAKELVANGRSVIIYPEGTRAREGDLGSFKKGAFTIAVRSGLPVLPVTIHGAHAAWPPGGKLIRGGPITVMVDDAIETEGMSIADASAVREKAHAVIEGRLRELSQSYTPTR